MSVQRNTIWSGSTLAALVLLVGLSGCKSREEEVMERFRKQKPPGYVRVINLSPNEVDLSDGGRYIGKVPVGVSRKPTTLAEGQRHLIVKGPTESKADIVVETKKVYTAIIWPDGSLSVPASGQPRKPEEGINGWVVFADKNGVKTSGSGKVVDPTGSKLDVTAGQGLTLMAGDYKSLDGSTVVKINPAYSYTFLFLDQGSKTQLYILINSDDMRPSLGGSG